MKSSANARPVSPEVYDTEYFLTELEGRRQFLSSRGNLVPERINCAMKLGQVGPGMRVLDVASGRGELLLQCAGAGADAVGIDYSSAAVDLASEAVKNAQWCDTSSIHILRVDAKNLPFPNNYFDRVFALEIVEHLHDWELDQALQEIRRTLAPDGKLIIHTMPNRWYYAVGYPLYRAFQRLKGKDLPRDPHDRWKYMSSVHVNEQDPVSLKGALKRNNFSARVWLQRVQTDEDAVDGLEAQAKRLLSGVFPFKLVFCSSIFAIATANKADTSASVHSTSLDSTGKVG